MSIELPPWAQYKPTEVPTIFDAKRAARNADFLKKVLGPKFLTGARQAPRHINHPILQNWVTNGANAFLELNALAEDIQCVHNAEGFTNVLRDLLRRDTCLPTWHTLHCAALLTRGGRSTVERFFPQTGETLPDFLLHSPDGLVACEAKHLAKSGQEEAFTAFAAEFSSLVKAKLLPDQKSYATLTIVLKSVDALPDVDFLLQAISTGLGKCTTGAVEFKHPQVNIVLDPTDAPPDACQKTIYIFGRKSDKEDLRVQERGKQASRQLAALATRDYPGLFLLSVGRLQDPEFIETLFRRRFEGGQYPGVSAAMLIRSGTQLSHPEAAPVDLTSVIRNPRTDNPLPNLRLDPVGLIGRLRNEDQTPQVPAYRHQSRELRIVAGQGDQFVYMRDLQYLTPAMLSD